MLQICLLQILQGIMSRVISSNDSTRVLSAEYLVTSINIILDNSRFESCIQGVLTNQFCPFINLYWIWTLIYSLLLSSIWSFWSKSSTYKLISRNSLMLTFGWERRVRVANELGAGNGKGARFATIVSVATSTTVGLVFWSLIIGFHDKIALIFSTSQVIQEVVNRLCILLAFSILLNSVQPVLSGEQILCHVILASKITWKK